MNKTLLASLIAVAALAACNKPADTTTTAAPEAASAAASSARSDHSARSVNRLASQPTKTAQTRMTGASPPTYFQTTGRAVIP